MIKTHVLKKKGKVWQVYCGINHLGSIVANIDEANSIVQDKGVDHICDACFVKVPDRLWTDDTFNAVLMANIKGK